MSTPLVIAVIDDDVVYQYTMKRTIEANQIDAHVLIFSDGEEGIKFISKNLTSAEVLPDLILLDINMPIMDGWQFLEEYIKLKPELNKKITICMISSSMHIADVERAKRIEDIAAYYVKPVSRQQVDEIVALHGYNLKKITY